MAPPPIGLLHHHFPVIPIPMHEQQQKRRDGEEDAIHDAKRKARLQHGAILVDVEVEGRGAADAIVVDGEGEAAVGGEVGTTGVRDAAEFVDSGDKGPDEAEIDEGGEEGGFASGFAAEHGRDSPCGGQDRDDEEDTEESCLFECGYQGDDLEEAPEGEQQAANHFGGNDAVSGGWKVRVVRIPVLLYQTGTVVRGAELYDNSRAGAPLRGAISILGGPLS
ncbi:MAG: hypothetical protein Q9228_000633 [Teloschistes exilis]